MTRINLGVSDDTIDVSVTETDYRDELVCGWIDIRFNGTEVTCMLDAEGFENETHAVRSQLRHMAEQIDQCLGFMDELERIRHQEVLPLG